jgi:two-component system, OmpR family, sensor kinase
MFKDLTLRTRLLLSYVLLLAITFTVVSVALIVLFSTRPAPSTSTFNRLAAIMQGVSLRTILDDFARGGQTLSQEFENAKATLDTFASSSQVRVLWLLQQDGEQVVLYDSAKTFPERTDIMVQDESYQSDPPPSNSTPPFGRPPNQLFGSFKDPNGQEWLFGGVQRDFRFVRRADVSTLLVVAEPRPLTSLRDALDQFGDAILQPLLQAIGLSLLLSLVMAALVSESLLKPLKNLLIGVQDVSRGNYGNKITEEGPTELRELAQAFNVMSEEVQSTQQAQRDFLANVSHDLKTPLTSIQGYSQAIMDGATKNPAQAARIIHDEAARLNRLVNELTDLIRMQAGGLSLKMSVLDFNAIVNAIAERLQVVAENKQVEIVVKINKLPNVGGDGDRLAQVLTNLLSNAIKFTPPDGIITVTTQATKSGVQLIVQDTGIGIPSEDLPRIFERFYQVDKARGPQRGTGLGLAITREIVQAHGGQIQVYSEGVNKGTTFIITLPLIDYSTIVRKRT